MNILHLSDLHFGADTEQPKIWYNQLAEDLIIELRCGRLDALVLSGDISSRSTPEEYRNAERFLRQLCEEFRLNFEHIVIVPGNHDLNWKLSEEAYEVMRREEYQASVGWVEARPDSGFGHGLSRAETHHLGAGIVDDRFRREKDCWRRSNSLARLYPSCGLMILPCFQRAAGQVRSPLRAKRTEAPILAQHSPRTWHLGDDPGTRH